MEQEINIKTQLAALIANPEKISSEDLPLLKELAAQYPYFQPLHLLMARAATVDDTTTLATAALYTNGQLVYNILHNTEFPTAQFNVIASPSTEMRNEPDALDEHVLDEVPTETEETADEDHEVYDEISEVNISAYQLPKEQVAETSMNEEVLVPAQDKLEADLVLENIVSTDFFAFQENFSVETAENEKGAAEIEEYREPEPIAEEPVVISKYDDDKLPYTFLWWLAKTRKEHQQIFQPYATPKQDLAEAEQEVRKQDLKKTSELQQQYIEHIFHLQGSFDVEEAYSPALNDKQSKGNEIIESFIKNEPQISPPNPEQINIENKAKKSAEDHNDLVSETLANIYIEQMLYDKAIETYEKLSLKFPEKSRYFADLIQSVEKKI